MLLTCKGYAFVQIIDWSNTFVKKEVLLQSIINKLKMYLQRNV
jgi:hypothetical protein